MGRSAEIVQVKLQRSLPPVHTLLPSFSVAALDLEAHGSECKLICSNHCCGCTVLLLCERKAASDLGPMKILFACNICRIKWTSKPYIPKKPHDDLQCVTVVASTRCDWSLLITFVAKEGPLCAYHSVGHTLWCWFGTFSWAAADIGWGVTHGVAQKMAENLKLLKPKIRAARSSICCAHPRFVLNLAETLLVRYHYKLSTQLLNNPTWYLVLFEHSWVGFVLQTFKRSNASWSSCFMRVLSLFFGSGRNGGFNGKTGQRAPGQAQWDGFKG